MFNGRSNQIRTYLDIYDPETEAALVQAYNEKLAGSLSALGRIITHLDMLAIFGKEVTLLGWWRRYVRSGADSLVTRRVSVVYKCHDS